MLTLKHIKKHNLASESSSCRNNAWEEDSSGDCRPSQANFEVHCNADGMSIKMSGDVMPDAENVSLLNPECAGTFDSDSQGS